MRFLCGDLSYLLPACSPPRRDVPPSPLPGGINSIKYSHQGKWDLRPILLRFEALLSTRGRVLTQNKEKPDAPYETHATLSTEPFSHSRQKSAVVRHRGSYKKDRGARRPHDGRDVPRKRKKPTTLSPLLPDNQMNWSATLKK